MGNDSNVTSTRRHLLRVGCVSATTKLGGCNLPTQFSKTEQATRTGSEQGAYTTITQEFDSLPAICHLYYADSMVQGIAAPVIVEFEITDGGFFGDSEIHDPNAIVMIEHGEIRQPLPGHFPEDVSVGSASGVAKVEGEGVAAAWSAGKRVMFGAVVMPMANTDEVEVTVQLRGRTVADGEVKEGVVEVDVETAAKAGGEFGREQIQTAAKHRERLASHYEDLVARKSFTQEARERFRDALMTVNIGGAQMLANEVFAQAVGISMVGDYLWNAYSLYFKTPFDYVLADASPDTPENVDDVPETEFGPPFFSELLAHADGLVEEFNELVRHFDHDARKAEGASRILLHSIAEAAEEEYQAWEQGDDERARQLVANQLYMINGDDRSADRDAVDQRFDSHEDLVDYHYFSARDTYREESKNLVQKLYTVRALRSSHPDFTLRLLGALRSGEKVFTGEGNRIADFLQFLDTAEDSESSSQHASVEGAWPRYQYDAANTGHGALA